VRVPRHAAGDVEEDGFEVIRSVDDAFSELVEGFAARVVHYLGNLGGIFVGFDLPIRSEHISGTEILGDLAGVALVPTSDDRVHVLKIGLMWSRYQGERKRSEDETE
jgi:hypothetical protein